MIVMRVPPEARKHLLARVPEWIMAVQLIWLGVQLSRPGASFSISHLYDTMARIAPEQTWATFALIVAALRLLSLALNGFFPVIRRITPGLRCFCAFLSGTIWLAMLVGFFAQNNNIIGIPAHGGAAIIDFTYALIIGAEFGENERRARHVRSK